MKLYERLKELPDDEFVYIGCVKGSNFLAINKVRNIREDLELVRQRNFIEYKKKIAEYEQQLIVLPEQIEKLKEELSKPLTIMRKEYVVTSIESKTNKVLKAQRNIPKLQEILNDFVPFLEREIVEEFKHTDIVEGTTLMISGKDLGKLWWFGEHSEKTLEELLDEC